MTRILMGIGVGILMLIGGCNLVGAAFPGSTANIRAVDRQADRLSRESAGMAKQQLGAIVDNYDNAGSEATRVAGNTVATRVGYDQGTSMGWRLRARNLHAAAPDPYVDVQRPWSNCIPFFEPLEVTASGYVTNLRRKVRSSIPTPRTVPQDDGFEKVGPSGTNRGDIGRGYDMPVADDEHFLGLVGRIADYRTRQPLTQPFFIGSYRELDPDRLGAMGCLQLAVNQNQYLSDAIGGFNYSFQPIE
jgi:hypothetical protein